MIMKKVFCVIPAYNEEKNIAQVINEVKSTVDQVVVVDDASRDNTYDLAKKQGVNVLRHLVNRGQGAGLQTGNEYALKNGADIIVHFDADGQFLASEIKDVVRPLQNGDCEIVFGSRFLSKKSDLPKFKKNVIMPLARFVNRFFLGVSLTDPQSGFRAMSRSAASVIEIQNDGMAHCSEILAKTFRGNFRFKEVPITVLYHDFGQRLGGGLKIIKDLLMAKFIS